MNELIVLLDGKEAGTVLHDQGRLKFKYSDSWRSAPDAYPLSLSMPLAGKVHSHAAIEPFIWGLLPDNDQVLARRGKEFGVSPRNAFKLISYLGEDCAGSVQFVRPEKLSAILEGDMPEPDWLSDADVASRLRTVRDDASAGRLPGDRGQFSLAGMQPKTSLLYYQGQWGVASGRTPTTHILKPASADMEGHAENEHLCLRLASALGMQSTESRVEYFEDVPTIVVKRFDRLMIAEAAVARKVTADGLLAKVAILKSRADAASMREADGIEREANEDLKLAENLASLAETKFVGRLHQEDFCQALSIQPRDKYQNDSGPGPREIVETIRDNVSSHAAAKANPKFPFAVDDDIKTFIDALIFNWMIGGTDAHAKNYSLLIGSGGMVRLAPLYDVSSFLVSPSYDKYTTTLAMKIGDSYRLRDIGLSDWKKFANSVRIDEAALVDRIRAMAQELPDRLSDEVTGMRAAGLVHAITGKLEVALIGRATYAAGL
jgi:serine/threonine-protein kinase HipA